MIRLTQFFMIRFRHHLVSTIQNFLIMKYTVLLAFILALSVATESVSKQALHVALDRILKTTGAPSAESMLRAGREDVKFCGTYEGDCEKDSGIASKTSMKILGMMHKNPIYMMNTADVFMGDCDDAGHLMGLSLGGTLKEVNEVQKKMAISFDKVLVTFYSEMATGAYKCKEPLEVGTQYNVMDLDCKDESGEDPFADVKEVIGTTQEAAMVFGEESVQIEDQTLKRTDDAGCTCAADLVKAATKSVTRLAKKNEEDVKFCGSYSTGCISGMINMKLDMKIMGMMHKNPIYMVYPVTVYMAPGCEEEQKATTLTLYASMKAMNAEKRKVSLKFEKMMAMFSNEAVIQGYTCTEPLELNKEYNIMDLDCKDESGEDPFAENKKMIGTTQESDMEFGENYMKILDDGSEVELQRLGDEGCTCERPHLRHFFTRM